MSFYTNVLQWGNFLLLREVSNGQRVNKRIKYSPTLYSRVEEPTPYTTLNGDYVSPVKLPTMREAKEWVEQYKNQPDLIFGNTQYAYCYLSDTYKGTVDWNLEQILIVNIDIEIPDDQKIKIYIYDINGRLIKKLINNKIMHKGYHTINWDASQFSSGIYFVNFEVKNKNIVKKITLLK